MYGGQAAAAGVEGYKSGYDFQEKAQSAYQDAQLKEQKIKQAVTNNKLLDIAYDDVVGGTQQESQMAQMQKIIDTQAQSIKKSNGATVQNDINTLTIQNDSKTRQEFIQSLKSKFKTNPELYASLGIKNAETMGVLNPIDSRDVQWMEDTLKQQGVKKEDYGDEWDDMVKQTMDAYPAIKADGAIVDLNGLSAATGSAVMASPQYNKIMETNLNRIKEVFNKEETRLDKNMKAVTGDRVFDNVETPDPSLISPTANDQQKYRDEMSAKVDVPIQQGGGIQTVDEPTYQTDENGAIYLANADGSIVKGPIDPKDVPTGAKTGKKNTGIRPDSDVIPIPGVNKEQLKSNEGFRSKAYKDSEGHWTIGYGHKIKPNEQHLMNANLSKEEGEALFNKDHTEHSKAFVDKEGWTTNQSPEVQEALHDMAFNMGPGWMDKFPSVRKALQEGDTKKAADIIRNSKYADQVGARADRNASLIDGSKPSISSEVSSSVREEINSSGGKPLDDMRMRKVYALLGKNYPDDPNEPTAKMKNYEFLRSIVGEERAFEGVFGSTTKSSRMGKLNREQARYPKGSKEWEQYEQMKKKIMYKGTGGEADKQYAQSVIDAFGDRTDLTEEEQADKYNALKTLEKQNKTATQRNQDSSIEHGKKGREMADTADSFLDKHPENKQALADLETGQQRLRIASPKTYQDEKEDIVNLKRKQVSVNRVADVLNRVNYGDLQDIKRGAVDSLKQWGSTKLDDPTTKLMDANTDGKWSETTKQNLKLGTALGLLQAEFIKAISGATVTDEERKILVRTMVGGGGWDTEEALKTALTEFYEAEKESMQYSGEQLSKGTSPYAGRIFSEAKELGEEHLQERNKKENRPSRTVNGETRYWDGTSWVK